jgi:sialic acid synthase SpsE
MEEIADALDVFLEAGISKDNITILHCNTEYPTPMRDVNLMAMLAIQKRFGVKIGYSDHTLGIEVPIAAVALGGQMIEKHFTDDVTRVGPDHAFSMDPNSWRDMVDRTRELENALGVGIKRIEDNEKVTAVLQRRAIRMAVDISAGTVLTREHLTILRPCPTDGLPPYHIEKLVGMRVRRDINMGEHLQWIDLE